MKENSKIIILILTIMTIVFTLLGSTFAYVNWQTASEQKTNIVFTMEQDFSCAADGGGNITSSEKVMTPASCTNSTHAIVREIKVTPTIFRTGLTIHMDLWLNVNTLDSGLRNSENFKYALTTNANSCTEGVIVSGAFKDKVAGDKVMLLEQQEYSTSEVQTYYLYVWLDAAETSRDTMFQTFNFSLGGNCTDDALDKNIHFDANGGSFTASYTTVGEHEYTVPYDGTYKLEVWGAQGGSYNSIYNGGYGGYSTGNIVLTSGTKLYVNVGGAGSVCAGIDCSVDGGYNGGGAGVGYSACGASVYAGSGGGATHISTDSGQLASLSQYAGNNNSPILIVAGGGGGGNFCNSTNYASGGSGGGITGSASIDLGALHFATNGGLNATGGNQTSGFGFGQGGSSTGASVGGGGGYYGGINSGINGAGGGSGYIGNNSLTNKYMYCYNCETSSETNTLTNSTTNISESAKSNYAKSGNGVAKISAISYAVEKKDGDAYGTLPTPTRAGYTFKEWNTEPDGTGETITEDTVFNSSNDNTTHAIWEANKYTVTYNSGNLIYNLNNISTTTSDRMNYSVSNGVVMVTANYDDGYGYINARVYLEANKTYIFNCKSSGAWLSDVEAYLMYNGDTSTAYYRLDSNNNYNFTPTVSGEYWIRLDVNTNGVTHTFSNIDISYDISSNEVISGGTYGTMPTPTRSGYKFIGWNTKTDGTGDMVSSSTIFNNAEDTKIYAKWSQTAVPIGTYLTNTLKPTGLNTAMQGGLYRFQGTNVNNYICFGTSTKSTCTGNTDKYMFRIIGVKSNGQLKLIKNEVLNSTTYSWSSSSGATWPNSYIYSGINGGYFLSGVASEWSNIITSEVWPYDGLYGSACHLANCSAGDMYNLESSFSTRTTAKIGLMHIHDYYYAAQSGGINCSASAGVYSYCTNGWIFLSRCDSSAPTTWEWFITRYGSQYGYTTQASGAVSHTGFSNAYSVRPVFYLNSSVNFLSGTGTSSDPFIISTS